MLDAEPNDGFTGVGSPGSRRHIAMGRLLVVDPRHEAMALHDAIHVAKIRAKYVSKERLVIALAERIAAALPAP